MDMDQTISSAVKNGRVESPGSCPYKLRGNNEKCFWKSYRTLAVCLSTDDVSESIEQHDGNPALSLPEGVNLLPHPLQIFQSKSYVYPGINSSQNTTPQSRPKTSADSNTNLPDLFNVYYMFNNACIDRLSQSSSLDPTSWKAYKGRLQFCVQTLDTDQFAGSMQPNTKVVAAQTGLSWLQAVRSNETAFCTKVDGESDEYCVEESLMQSISMQMGYMFDASATIDASDRSTIVYSSELAAVLLKEVLGETWQGSPLCDSKRGSGGQNPNPFFYYAIQGFRLRLERIGNSLTYV
jgi:hypothetical protein